MKSDLGLLSPYVGFFVKNINIFLSFVFKVKMIQESLNLSVLKNYCVHIPNEIALIYTVENEENIQFAYLNF